MLKHDPAFLTVRITRCGTQPTERKGCFVVSKAAGFRRGTVWKVVSFTTYQDGEPKYRCSAVWFGENALTRGRSRRDKSTLPIGVIGLLRQAMEAINRCWQQVLRQTAEAKPPRTMR